MTQAQLNSMAKRINTALTQYEKTFGVNSEAYKNYEEQIKQAVGVSNVHITKSGHTAISLGKYLQYHVDELKKLDNPANKVKGRLKEAEHILQEEFKEQNPDVDVVDIPKFLKSQIIEKVNKTTGFENFFNYEIGDLYAMRQQSPRLDYLLSLLEEKTGKGNGYKFTYTQLNDIITECLEIKAELLKNKEPMQLTQEQIAEQRAKGGLRI